MLALLRECNDWYAMTITLHKENFTCFVWIESLNVVAHFYTYNNLGCWISFMVDLISGVGVAKRTWRVAWYCEDRQNGITKDSQNLEEIYIYFWLPISMQYESKMLLMAVAWSLTMIINVGNKTVPTFSTFYDCENIRESCSCLA